VAVLTRIPLGAFVFLRLPDLANVCVFVVGADPSSQQGARVRAFWQKYFATAGARMPSVNYRNMVSDVGEMRC
jgi:hypothetical protein